MDRRLLPYVTFLQENGAAPFAEYILCRELLENAEESEAAYAWATLFPLYDDLVGEQREDGSWGAYLSADTATSKNCKYKTTARAFMRIRDLALPADDPAVVRARALLHRYLSGETPLPDTMSPRNFTQRAAIRRQALFDLAPCEPADERVRAFRALLAERVEYACASGRFDRERFRAAGVEEPLRPGETTDDVLLLLAAGGLLDERMQRCLPTDLWEEWLYNDTARCGEPPAPPAWQFRFWLLLEQARLPAVPQIRRRTRAAVSARALRPADRPGGYGRCLRQPLPRAVRPVQPVAPRLRLQTQRFAAADPAHGKIRALTPCPPGTFSGGFFVRSHMSFVPLCAYGNGAGAESKASRRAASLGVSLEGAAPFPGGRLPLRR